MLNKWNESATSMSLQEAMSFAKSNNFEFFFDWDMCRTEEGYYKIQGCLEYSVKRSLLYSDYADLLWMETPTPNLEVANEFASKIHQ